MEFDDEAAHIAEPEFPWEKGEGSTHNYPIAEGPTALFHDGKIFVVFSANDTASFSLLPWLLMHVGHNPMVRANWKKTPHSVFESAWQNGFTDPVAEHIRARQGRQHMLIYAAKTSDAPNARVGRVMRAQHFIWKAEGTPNSGILRKDGLIQP